MSRSNGTTTTPLPARRPVGRPRKVKQAETKPDSNQIAHVGEPHYLWNRSGWLLCYNPRADGTVTISRSFYGYAIDSLNLSMEPARVHYASQKKSGMKPLASL